MMIPDTDVEPALYEGLALLLVAELAAQEVCLAIVLGNGLRDGTRGVAGCDEENESLLCMSRPLIPAEADAPGTVDEVGLGLDSAAVDFPAEGAGCLALYLLGIYAAVAVDCAME